MIFGEVFIAGFTGHAVLMTVFEHIPFFFYFFFTEHLGLIPARHTTFNEREHHYNFSGGIFVVTWKWCGCCRSHPFRIQRFTQLSATPSCAIHKIACAFNPFVLATIFCPPALLHGKIRPIFSPRVYNRILQPKGFLERLKIFDIQLPCTPNVRHNIPLLSSTKPKYSGEIDHSYGISGNSNI